MVVVILIDIPCCCQADSHVVPVDMFDLQLFLTLCGNGDCFGVDATHQDAGQAEFSLD